MRTMAVIWFKIAALAFAGCLLANNSLAAERTYVLVHGAFVGAWYWKPVVKGLEERGHTVIAVDLTGHGERAGENNPEITLQTHIDDVVEAINSSGQSVVLVSHSYGGRPATGAWDIARDKVSAVIYLEAMSPYGNGKNALQFDYVQRMNLAEILPSVFESGLMQPPSYIRNRYPNEVVVPQSIEALHAAVPLKKGPLPDTPGAYVIGSKSGARVFRTYAQRVALERGWTIYEIETGHDMVYDNFDVVVRLLDELGRTLPKQ